MLRRIAIIALIMCFAGVAFAADPPVQTTKVPDYTGVWKGNCMLSAVEAHVYQKGDKIKGVAVVRAWGQTNYYHFKGKVTQDGISAAHFRGHSFKGKPLVDDTVTGVLTTAKKGYKLDLTAKRVSDTPTLE